MRFYQLPFVPSQLLSTHDNAEQTDISHASCPSAFMSFIHGLFEVLLQHIGCIRHFHITYSIKSYLILLIMRDIYASVFELSSLIVELFRPEYDTVTVSDNIVYSFYLNLPIKRHTIELLIHFSLEDIS